MEMLTFGQKGATRHVTSTSAISPINIKQIWKQIKTNIKDIWNKYDDWKQVCDGWSCWLLDKKAPLVTSPVPRQFLQYISNKYENRFWTNIKQISKSNTKEIWNKYVIDGAVDFCTKRRHFSPARPFSNIYYTNRNKYKTNI